MTLQQLGYKTYQQYLAGKEWFSFKKKIWSSSAPKECRICESQDNLNFHHRSYENLGKETFGVDVVLLCRTCHHAIHFYGGRKTQLLRRTLVKRERQLYRLHHSWLAFIYLRPSEVCEAILDWLIQEYGI